MREARKPSKNLVKASREILEILKKYPELAYHVLLVEKEGETCTSLLEGSQNDIFRGIFHVAAKVDMFRELLEVAVHRLRDMEHPTEEEMADTLIDSYLKLRSKGKDEDAAED